MALHCGMVDDPVGAFFAAQLPQIAVVMIDFQNDFCSPEPFGADAPNTHNAATALRANEFARQASDLGPAVPSAAIPSEDLVE